MKQFETLKEFYPFYLTEHSNRLNRNLHFTGTFLLILNTIVALITGKYWLLFLVPLIGYGFAWVGHFFIEKNKPATFKNPFYSFVSDFIMFWHILTNQIQEKLEAAKKLFPTNN